MNDREGDELFVPLDSDAPPVQIVRPGVPELLAIAEELDHVATREEDALVTLTELGYRPSEGQLNYPSEQRAHAAGIRAAVEKLGP